MKETTRNAPTSVDIWPLMRNRPCGIPICGHWLTSRAQTVLPMTSLCLPAVKICLIPFLLNVILFDFISLRHHRLFQSVGRCYTIQSWRSNDEHQRDDCGSEKGISSSRHFPYVCTAETHTQGWRALLLLSYVYICVCVCVCICLLCLRACVPLIHPPEVLLERVRVECACHRHPVVTDRNRKWVEVVITECAGARRGSFWR